MRKTAYLTLLAMLFCGAANSQAYKWIDEDGIVHYSDRPHEGAELIQLPRDDRPRSATQRPAPTRAQSAAPEPQDDANGYQSLSVASPGPEETLWNLEGSLNVSLALSPGLKQGHRIRVYFDGQPRMVTGTSFEIEEVFRAVILLCDFFHVVVAFQRLAQHVGHGAKVTDETLTGWVRQVPHPSQEQG